MESSPRKAVFTRKVLSAARRFPALFPRRIRCIAESHEHFINRSANKKFPSWASFFYDPEKTIKLKGIGCVLELTSRELAMLREWHERSKHTWIDDRHVEAVYARSYLSSPRENIVGNVSFGGNLGPGSVDHLEDGPRYFSGCLLSLALLPSGSAYLNLYFWAKPTATGMVQGVDTSSLTPTAEFKGYNLFRTNNLAVSYYRSDYLAGQMLRDRMAMLEDDAFAGLDNILKKIGMPGSSCRYIFKGWDFINDSDRLIFADQGNSNQLDDYQAQEYVYRTYQGACVRELLSKGVFLDLNEFKSERYDLLEVRSQRYSSFGREYDLDEFTKSANQIFDSVMVVSLPGHFYYKIKCQLKILEKHIGFELENTHCSEKQTKLFSIIENLTLVKDEIDQLRKYTSWVCPERYLAVYEGRLNGLSDFVLKVLARADREYKFVNDKINIKIVNSNRHYSLMLGVFAVVQIALACLAIDWGKWLN